MVVRKIRAKLVLRLRAEGFSGRQIAGQGMSRTSVAAVLDAADREGVDYVDVADLDEAAVYSRLFPGRGEHESVHAQLDWDRVHRELAKVGVTLKLLHGEYLDIRGQQADRPERYAGGSYDASQAFGETVRASGGAGLLYDSLRRRTGVTIVAHRPRNIADITQTDHFEITVSSTLRTIEIRKLSA